MVATTPITRIKKKVTAYIHVISLRKDDNTTCACVQHQMFEVQYV